MCCHPALDVPARVALTLRSVCGLSTGEIAVAFLVPEETMAKRLEPAPASRSFIARRLRELRSGVNGGRDLRLCGHHEGWRARST